MSTLQSPKTSLPIATSAPSAGRHWLGISAVNVLLNTMHAVQQRCAPKFGKLFPVGVATSRRAWGSRGRPSFTPPPSVAEALCKLTVAPGFAAGLPFVRFGEPDDPVQIVSEGLGSDVVHVQPPALIPVSGALHESKQLHYNRPGAPLCASGCECQGAIIAGAPGPLSVYQTPAEAAAGAYPPSPAFCLLCIRADSSALSRTLSTIVSSSRSGLGMAAMVLPPFQNIVNTEDGYKEECLGVRSTHTFVFTPISIVGPADLPVEYDEQSGGFYVDQQSLLWGVPDTPSN